MERIVEWISDNLRYILLGVALVLVLVLAILGVKAITGLRGGSSTPKATEKQTEQQTEANSDVIVDPNGQPSTPANVLVQNDTKVLTTMTAYYTARTNKDIATLKKLDPSVDETQVQAELDNSYVEGYSNIKTYSTNGPEEGSAVAYVCFDGKVKDIDTLVPSLTQFYLKTAEDGTYYIADATGNAQAESFIDNLRKSSEVQSLIDAVAKNCDDAENSDPVLKEFMKKYGNSQDDDSDDAKGDDEEDDDTKEVDGDIMYANDGCNVRSEASVEGEILGGLVYGDEVTVIGQEDDWSIIDFGGEKAYVKSEFLSSEDDFNQAVEANYFAPAGY